MTFRPKIFIIPLPFQPENLCFQAIRKGSPFSNKHSANEFKSHKTQMLRGEINVYQIFFHMHECNRAAIYLRMAKFISRNENIQRMRECICAIKGPWTYEICFDRAFWRKWEISHSWNRSHIWAKRYINVVRKFYSYVEFIHIDFACRMECNNLILSYLRSFRWEIGIDRVTVTQVIGKSHNTDNNNKARISNEIIILSVVRDVTLYLLCQMLICFHKHIN